MAARFTVPHSPYPPDDPREWLRRARGNLTYARVESEGVLAEDRAFNAQQAAEKALKAVLLHAGETIPFTHDLRELIGRLIRAGIGVPPEVDAADVLTPYAVAGRYPADTEEMVTAVELVEAIAVAAQVVEWVEGQVAGVDPRVP
jgi:HEPN domain-containing protein